MPAPLQLPAGLTSRPLVPSDAAAITEVIAAQELADVGEVVVELADLVADYQRPGYDVAAHSVGVFAEDELVALAEVGWITDRGEGRDQRRRGLAQALLVDGFRAGAEHGSPRAELSTDSRTGALGLYAKVGMTIRTVWLNRAIELGA